MEIERERHGLLSRLACVRFSTSGDGTFPPATMGNYVLDNVKYIPPPQCQGCGPHGAAVKSLTSCDITSGRNFDAKPSTKSLLAKTAAQCLRRSASSSNFHRCTSWLIVPVSAWKYPMSFLS